MHIQTLQNRLGRWRNGALLIEVLLGITLFGMFATAAFLTLLTGQESTRTGSDRIRGVYYTEQAIEISKALRDDNFDQLLDGEHGFDLSEAGHWILTGSSISRHDYNTSLLISDSGSEQKRIVAHSDWKHGIRRSGATLLTVHLTDWRSEVEVGDWSGVTQLGSFTDSGLPLFNDVTVSGDYAYVTSEISDGGDGLYIFDISTPSSPSRVSSSFSLSGAAHKPVVRGTTLYVAVEESGDEIKAYDIADPTSLSSGTAPIASYDIAGGNARVRSLAVAGDTLYAGATQHSSGEGQEEFYSFDISTPSAITLRDSLEITATVNDIAIHGGYAHLATDADVGELTVIDVSNPDALASHSGYNAIDTHDGYAVRATGTGFYLGRQMGASIDEYVLVTGSDGVPGTEPSDTHGADLGGSVQAMDIDPLGCYAFLATDFGTKELQIRRADQTGIPEVAYLDLPSDARGIYHELIQDRLYVVTNDTLYIYRSGHTASPCSS